MKFSHGTSLRSRLEAAALDHRDRQQPLRLLAKRMAPLARAGEQLGRLMSLLRLTVGQGESRGVLVFEWPHRSAHHSALTGLDSWVAGSVDGRATHGDIEVEYREVVAAGVSGEEPGSHLKIWFDLRNIPDEMLSLLELAARIGIDEAMRRELAAAPQPETPQLATAHPATQHPATASVDEAEVVDESRDFPEPDAVMPASATDSATDVEPELPFEIDLAAPDLAMDVRPEPADAAEMMVDVPAEAPAEAPVAARPAPPSPTAPSPAAPSPAAPSPADPAEQAQIDTVAHNAVYDRNVHPAIAVNDEVTNSDGEVFRLVQKRVGGVRKRVWTRVTENASPAELNVGR